MSVFFASALSPQARAELFNHDIMPVSSCCLSYKQLGDSRGKESSIPPKSVTKDFHLADSRHTAWLPTPQPCQQPAQQLWARCLSVSLDSTCNDPQG